MTKSITKPKITGKIDFKNIGNVAVDEIKLICPNCRIASIVLRPGEQTITVEEVSSISADIGDNPIVTQKTKKLIRCQACGEEYEPRPLETPEFIEGVVPPLDFDCPRCLG